ncbi:MAG: methyl-accepting chemotaxis protein [Nitrospirae bacterium]|nr:methyl-accepting chemotaxis protein [Nitrospirota bacterium]
MHLLREIRNSISARLLMKIAIVLIAGVVFSGTAFYLLARKILLSPSYAETFVSVDMYKDMVLSRSIFIYAFFTLLILCGIVILGIIYSHRIAGPLQRVKAAARELGKGNLGINIRFRERDVIHPLADSINRMAGQYKERYAKVSDAVQKMAENIPELDSAVKSKNRDLVNRAILSLSEASSEVEEILSRLKL